MHVCEIQKNGTDEPICKAEIETQIQRTYGHQAGGGGGGGGGAQGTGEWDKLGDWD